MLSQANWLVLKTTGWWLPLRQPDTIDRIDRRSELTLETIKNRNLGFRILHTFIGLSSMVGGQIIQKHFLTFWCHCSPKTWNSNFYQVCWSKITFFHFVLNEGLNECKHVRQIDNKSKSSMKLQNLYQIKSQHDGLRITIKKGTPKIISKSISTMPRECPVGYKNLICPRYHYYKISF